MTRSLAVAAVLLAVVACGRAPPSPQAQLSPPAAPEPQSSPPPAPMVARPQPVTAIDLAHCFAVAGGTAQPDEARCPSFMSEDVTAAMQTCKEVGGKLLPAPSVTAWSVDFNGDGNPEFLYASNANVNCDGAPSVFSCGSLGCPVWIYQRHDGGWRIIGAVSEGALDSIEFLPGEETSSFRNFRTGCIDAGPCPEYAHFAWTGNGYEVTKLDVRGFDVDLDGPVHGLANVPAAMAVLATPEPGGEVLDRYAEGTEVVVIGEHGDYYYVSPCNACRSGFVQKSAVSREQ